MTLTDVTIGVQFPSEPVIFVTLVKSVYVWDGNANIPKVWEQSSSSVNYMGPIVHLVKTSATKITGSDGKCCRIVIACMTILYLYFIFHPSQLSLLHL